MEKKKEKEVAVVSQDETSVDNLLAKAIEQKVPVETLERLLVMRRQLKEEWSKQEFDKAMSNFQAECPVIAKVKKGYGYFYAPLEHIVETTKELRQKYGLSYNFVTKMETNKVVVTCFANHISGYSKSSQSEMPIVNITSNTGKDVMSAPQTVGSATTYAKRYAFIDVFGIVSGDEDLDARTERTEEDLKKQIEEAKEKLQGAMNMNALGVVWSRISGEIKSNEEVVKTKDEMKKKFEVKVATETKPKQ